MNRIIVMGNHERAKGVVEKYKRMGYKEKRRWELTKTDKTNLELERIDVLIVNVGLTGIERLFGRRVDEVDISDVLGELHSMGNRLFCETMSLTRSPR